MREPEIGVRRNRRQAIGNIDLDDDSFLFDLMIEQSGYVLEQKFDVDDPE